ncbi:MAG TPA: aldehyde dehydrogenase family protein [Bosea sp. (in: a-proteobacteria)]|jgi:1-pyrroline-5-carboxylate dehydrogenase|uniref:aldehyde dehydrogenase family protein n=1 Tax=Bosea sp. (in: a-proteobacteria) TaxID=1871050 RepID=UPI002E12E672|nr:aldehyde dehydrogenase family protein [Bosea sp. (in: a-proteobacteria)]
MNDVAALPRVTYSNIAEDFSGVHAHFGKVIAEMRGRQLGLERPNHVGGRDSTEGTAYDAPCPIDRRLSLGTFFAASPREVDSAVAAARAAQRGWRDLGWPRRVALARAAADLLEARKFEVAAACLLEVGKSRMEALGEVEEAIDLIRFYAGEMEANDGFRRDLARANPREETFDVLRPYGVFAVIAPFNFPVALSLGMSICALLAGNTVVFKPSPMAGLTGRLLSDCLVEAGLPAGVFNLICGGAETGAALAAHSGIDGIAFTGSHAVGMRMLREFGCGGRHARPVLAEMGGKNPTYVAASADLDTAVSGVLRSAFGLQGQKCSAGSVVFLHETLADAFLDRFRSAAAALVVDDPCERESFMGPLISEAALERFETSRMQAKSAGGRVHGGERLTGGLYDHGAYVRPAIVTGLPDDHALHRDELFMPFLTVRTFSDLGDAIARGNAVPYGLTAGVYTGEPAELEEFLETAEAGVLYANRASGATTGAWPGIQTFCGWKGSGTGSKGGLGAWYLPQFMREQSHTIMR